MGSSWKLSERGGKKKKKKQEVGSQRKRKKERKVLFFEMVFMCDSLFAEEGKVEEGEWEKER